MSAIFQVLIATVLIVGLIVLRTVADRYVLRTRIRGDHTNGDCEQTGCCRRIEHIEKEH